MPGIPPGAGSPHTLHQQTTIQTTDQSIEGEKKTNPAAYVLVLYSLREFGGLQVVSEKISISV